MDVDVITRTIQLILAPVVMVTACAILLGSIQARYGTINDRLRAMSRERLDLLRATGGSSLHPVQPLDTYTRERFEQIDAQTPDLLRRHTLIRDSLLAIYSAVAVFLATMFVIAFAAAVKVGWVALLILGFFLAGTAVLLIGVALVAVEVHGSHRAVQYEMRRVLSLGR